MFNRRRKRNIPGLSLVEVLVGMSVLSVGLLGFVSTVQSSNSLGRRGDNTAIATRLAADSIANFQANNVSLLPNGTTTAALSQLPSGSMTVNIAPYLNDTSEHFMKQIDVTITWAGTAGMEQAGGSVNMSTLVAARK